MNETPLPESGTIPWVFEVAARLESEPRLGMYTDAGVITRSLSAAASLFDLPIITSTFDTTLEAQAAGCSIDWKDDRPVVKEGCIESIADAFDLETDIEDYERIPVVIDATNRLCETVDTNVFAGVTGPATLTDHLLVGETDDYDSEVIEETLFTASDLCLSMINVYLENGADGITLLEPWGITRFDSYQEAATPLVNVLEHYQTHAVIASERITADDVDYAAHLGFHGITGTVSDLESISDANIESDIAIGIGIPDDVFLNGVNALETFVTDLDRCPLLSSEFTVPEEMEPEVLHAMGSLD